jgi:hypothetical protein
MDLATSHYISHADVLAWSENNNMKVAPMIYEGKIESMEWLESYLADELKKESDLGGEREGFVVRVKDSFHKDHFSSNVFKYVRKGHVQTDEHWSRNWKQAKLSDGQV